MRPPAAVIFDWCNTLVRDSELDYEIAEKVLERVGRSDIDISSVDPGRVVKYLEYALGSRWQDAVTLYREFAEQSAKVRKLVPSDNALELLELLYDNKISMGIVSNKNGELLRKEVQTIGWSKYFSAVIGSGDTPENKPSPKPVIAALEILDIETPCEQVLFIGDSISDVTSAQRAKCCPIVYGSIKTEGVLSFENFADLSVFVRGLLN
ncbi:HAD family hydrolase [Anaplasma capra]|uniref:HAD family hydrolase n=1 Tax=Anaplasma capra TaxID=1562740 RepID=UPI0021D573C6|nr:HAD family hydrolase [Anaplasma capra]MCU7611694.1 HAD family hydrolase [Anaplasma capra]MCU7612556.1 HAD family hydrolase [Anaplasma capra]